MHSNASNSHSHRRRIKRLIQSFKSLTPGQGPATAIQRRAAAYFLAAPDAEDRRAARPERSETPKAA